MKNNNLLMTVIIVVVVAAAAFFVGMKYQGMQANATGGNGLYVQGENSQSGANGQGRFGRRGGNFGGATVGEIVSVDANSMTIKLQDGSSKIVNLSGSTTISKMSTASKSDLTAGQRVAAIGTTNSDGSITAQNIQLNPMFRNGGPGRQGGQPNPTQ